MDPLYNKACIKSSKVITNCYSTSFSIGIKMLDSSIHDAVYAIYGFVRFADEIVDTFHDHKKKNLLKDFEKETYDSIERQLSLNPILHSFQLVVNEYKIEQELIRGFLKSMELDLTEISYTEEGINEYIYGSAEVVGLMCLRVFCNGDESKYQELKEPAQYLGSAFQKINFLRDIKDDFLNKGRSYFPNVNLNEFSEEAKKKIEKDLLDDFSKGYEGIKRLPKNSKLGVYTAYVYYFALFEKIKKVSAKRVMEERIRVSDSRKYWLLLKAYLRFKLGTI